MEDDLEDIIPMVCLRILIAAAFLLERGIGLRRFADKGRTVVDLFLIVKRFFFQRIICDRIIIITDDGQGFCFKECLKDSIFGPED